jgi:hypothetical protein
VVERLARDFGADAPLRDFAAEAARRVFEAEELVRDFAAVAPLRDFAAVAPLRDFAAVAPLRDFVPEALVLDLAARVERLPELPCARVRAALRAAVERVAALRLRVRAALRAAVWRSPLSVWPFNSATRASRRSTESRSALGACLPSDTWPGKADRSRATLFRIPLSRILP